MSDRNAGTFIGDMLGEDAVALETLAPVVEAARGIKRAEDAKDQGEWVKCHEIMYRALATMEAAHADA